MSETVENQIVQAPRRRTLKGLVVSDKMDKTIIVAVNRKKKHPRYDKIITLTKKYFAHDYKDNAGIGDFVLIEETRPLSKNKGWRLVEILQKAK